MTYEAKTQKKYIAQLPEDRKEVVEKLQKIILKNLPNGFEHGINYNMLGWYVPHSTYPNGYHCNPKDPLPFMNLASQKNSVNLYHSGIYAKPELHDWFINEYPKHSKYKLDMGKSCIRFKRMNDIPYKLIAELCTKISVEDWIKTYEANVVNRKK